MIIARYSEEWPCASAMGNHCLASGSTSWQHQSPGLFKSSCWFVAVKSCHPVAGRASEHRLMGRSLAVEALASSKVDSKSIELIIMWCNAFLNPEGELWSHFFEEKNPDRALNVFSCSHSLLFLSPNILCTYWRWCEPAVSHFHQTCCHELSVQFLCTLTNLSLCSLFLFLRNGFLTTTLPMRSFLMRLHETLHESNKVSDACLRFGVKSLLDFFIYFLKLILICLRCYKVITAV